jgi:hypothetical protein
MIIKIDTQGSPALDSPENFTSFHVETDPDAEPRVVSRSLRRLGAVSDEGAHLWVDPDRLRDLVPPEVDIDQWAAGLSKMTGYAERQGWVNDQGWIRAHIQSRTG